MRVKDGEMRQSANEDGRLTDMSGNMSSIY